MTNSEIQVIARRQSALEAGCRPEDFDGRENVSAVAGAPSGARRYLELPLFCNLVSYGSNIVVSAREDFLPLARAYADRWGVAGAFSTPAIHRLEALTEERGHRICFMAEYFLPDVERLAPLPCRYPVRLLEPEQFQELYVPAWSNALCEKRRELDVLAVGAYDGGKLIGLAGCSADCEEMWQIGIDILPDYRRQGVASALTSRLAAEILQRGKVPFYCAAWSNLPSVRSALRSGFRPAWVEMTAKPIGFVEEMLG